MQGVISTAPASSRHGAIGQMDSVIAANQQDGVGDRVKDRLQEVARPPGRLLPVPSNKFVSAEFGILGQIKQVYRETGDE